MILYVFKLNYNSLSALQNSEEISHFVLLPATFSFMLLLRLYFPSSESRSKQEETRAERGSYFPAPFFTLSTLSFTSFRSFSLSLLSACVFFFLQHSISSHVRPHLHLLSISNPPPPSPSASLTAFTVEDFPSPLLALSPQLNFPQDFFSLHLPF